MQNIFSYLASRNKSQLLNILRTYFKKYPDINSSELTEKFLEDEIYYFEINNPRLNFLEAYFENYKFKNELIKYFDFLKYKKPYVEKQKEYARKLRKSASEYKMSKLKPTKKQLIYYDKLTKSKNINKKELEGATRLDLKNWIGEIVSGGQDDSEN